MNTLPGMFYKLGGADGRQPIECQTVEEYAEWAVKNPDRRVGFDVVGDVKISTVFLMAHNGHPFETMIFGGEFDCRQVRYETWEDAQAGHDAVVKIVRDRALWIKPVLTLGKVSEKGHLP